MSHQNPSQILTGADTDPPDPGSQARQPPNARLDASNASQGDSAEKTLRLALIQAASEKDVDGYVRIPAMMLTAMAAMIQILEDTKESLQDTTDLLRQVISARGPTTTTTKTRLPRNQCPGQRQQPQRLNSQLRSGHQLPNPHRRMSTLTSTNQVRSSSGL